ncbi:hypothetical protein HANVADRAFT_53217 [Hanseniaspora valbyensis NRRL Y-1626]|uniref:Spore wall maturation protein DIT1 n=1 Tax=Hanseniaspora valbyensis NRRL Y-1626 TaxID=766949 RepID=A0A1B7TC74_9ASCO|nr:hypothetical protein HANVADRAFT_53217 [Hanseniaspora valbyensis NRRL Y-1626]
MKSQSDGDLSDDEYDLCSSSSSLPVLRKNDKDYSTKISNDYNIDHSVDNKLSCFEKILCLYTVPLNKDDVDIESPLSIIDKQKSIIGKNFTDFYINYFQKYATPLSFEFSDFNPNLKVYKISGKHVSQFTNVSPDIDIKIIELVKEGESHVRGLIATIEDDKIGVPQFSDWFMYHLLEVSKLDYFKPSANFTSNNYHKIVADYFNTHLKNHIKNDLWEAEGQYSFIEKLKYFTERMLPIQAILPAFPCKSTNLQKVSGTEPDLGEAFALETLMEFCRDVKKKFYPPGFKIWIVSDGHVFSDCIGADDCVIDNFTSQLHDLYLKLKKQYSDEDNELMNDCIGFFGLKDVFYSEESGKLFNEDWLSGIHLKHYTGSKIEHESEICREIMMAACNTDNGRLSKQVKIENHPRLLLYRGFTKFMEEDIGQLEFISKMSRKQQKKLAAKIAFEMIKRNDAYSNLVDLCFPHYMRLSIHAHQNSGPKYGIKVVSPTKCRVIKSFSDLAYPNYDDFLHIPTPWHNVVIKNMNNGKYYFGRSNIVAQAIQSKSFIGELKDNSNSCTYYELKSRDEFEDCEFDDVFDADEILSRLKMNYLQAKVDEENDNKAVLNFLNHTNSNKINAFMNTNNIDATIRKSVDSSNTVVFDEGSASSSKTDFNNLTPYMTKLNDQELERKLENDLEELNLDSANV